MLKLTEAELVAFLAEAFPKLDTTVYAIDTLRPEALVLRMKTTEEHLRPGGTVSGPTLMTMADTASYLFLVAHIGRVALAVTTSLSIHFLNKPEPGDLVGKATMLKLGKRLAVMEVAMRAGTPTLVAQATVTYSIP